MPLLSIIVPVYQAKKDIKKCIDSIRKQSFSDFELILVDDGSSDGSEKICDEYAEKDNRIKTIHQTNRGVSSARNMGLEYARGTYIAFVDADDWIEPDLFQECMRALEKSRTDTLYHGFMKDIWKNNKVNSIPKGIPVYKGIISKEMMKKYIVEREGDINVNVFSYIFSRKLIKNLRFDINMPYAEDTVFVMQALAKAQSYYFFQNYGYHYNARLGSAAYRWQPKLIECYQKSFREIISFFKTLDLSKQDRNRFMAIKAVNGYASLIYNLCLPTCTISLREKTKILNVARKEFKIDSYKRFYEIRQLCLFEKVKTLLTFVHLEIILILLGSLYCKRN